MDIHPPSSDEEEEDQELTEDPGNCSDEEKSVGDCKDPPKSSLPLVIFRYSWVTPPSVAISWAHAALPSVTISWAHAALIIR